MGISGFLKMSAETSPETLVSNSLWLGLGSPFSVHPKLKSFGHFFGEGGRCRATPAPHEAVLLRSTLYQCSSAHRLHTGADGQCPLSLVTERCLYTTLWS